MHQAYWIGAVLSHVIDSNQPPTALASRTTTNSECNYAQVEEALALFSQWKFNIYLYNCEFTLITDHS